MERKARKGRGAVSNATGRYESLVHEAVDDGWGLADELPLLRTSLSLDTAKRVISYNQSPDVSFDRSVNPYRGCEHGCVYCFARPTHTWLGLSAGLDFESRLFYKPDAVERLREELSSARYQCQPLALGINTDAYQPVERKVGLTRRILELLAEVRHPVILVTKSSLIERDIDLLAPMAASQLVSVSISISTLSRNLSRRLEPRASTGNHAQNRRRGIPLTLLMAPVIPVITDSEMETILQAGREAGAGSAAYVLLRLPHEVRDLFIEWLEEHERLRASHVMSKIREMRGGREYDSRFGSRMKGEGVYADLLKQRFRLALKRYGYVDAPSLDTSAFCHPLLPGQQMSLF